MNDIQIGGDDKTWITLNHMSDDSLCANTVINSLYRLSVSTSILFHITDLLSFKSHLHIKERPHAVLSYGSIL